MGGLVFPAVALVLFPLFPGRTSWLAIQIFSGAGYGAFWIMNTALVNRLATDFQRGRITALYGLVPAAGSMMGSLLTQVTGLDGFLPFAVAGSLMALGIMVIGLMLKVAPAPNRDGRPSLPSLMRLFPSIFLVALIAGLFETTPWGMLPVYALASGVHENAAVSLMSVFFLGQMIFSIPIGYLMDRGDPRRVLTWTAALAVVGCLILPLVIHNAWLSATVVLVWSPVISAFYSGGLALLGFRFRGTILASASALFMMSYQLGGMIGTPLAGTAMDLWGPAGFTMLLAGVAALGGASLLLVLRRGPPEASSPSPAEAAPG